MLRFHNMEDRGIIGDDFVPRRCGSRVAPTLIVNSKRKKKEDALRITLNHDAFNLGSYIAAYYPTTCKVHT